MPTFRLVARSYTIRQCLLSESRPPERNDDCPYLCNPDTREVRKNWRYGSQWGWYLGIEATLAASRPHLQTGSVGISRNNVMILILAIGQRMRILNGLYLGAWDSVCEWTIEHTRVPRTRGRECSVCTQHVRRTRICAVHRLGAIFWPSMS